MSVDVLGIKGVIISVIDVMTCQIVPVQKILNYPIFYVLA